MDAVEPIRPSEALAWYVLDQILPLQPNTKSLQSPSHEGISRVRTMSEIELGQTIEPEL
jgi:hypothetical protein